MGCVDCEIGLSVSPIGASGDPYTPGVRSSEVGLVLALGDPGMGGRLIVAQLSYPPEFIAVPADTLRARFCLSLT